MSERELKVTTPLLPPLEELTPILKEIWGEEWITNNGRLHSRLERELESFLGVDRISLFTNGTLPLVTALQALEIRGEVITTPYSFVATSHSIIWNGLRPVFVDVDPIYGNLDPERIEEAITPQTTAIMPVHVYGNPCDTDRIETIAYRHGLKVVYDAAHAFGVRRNGRSILRCGDMSTLSFHATKTYTTAEGGALICATAEMKQKADYLKNFGFAGETEVIMPGINSKMDEIRAAMGLVNLKYVASATARRRKATETYRRMLKNISGLRFLEDIPGVEHNYGYFPIFIDKEKYGISRDALYERLKKKGIYGRRYFYPLITDFHPYSSLPSARPENLVNARRLASQVICLPMHHQLNADDVERVVSVIIESA